MKCNKEPVLERNKHISSFVLYFSIGILIVKSMNPLLIILIMLLTLTSRDFSTFENSAFGHLVSNQGPLLVHVSALDHAASQLGTLRSGHGVNAYV